MSKIAKEIDGRLIEADNILEHAKASVSEPNDLVTMTLHAYEEIITAKILSSKMADGPHKRWCKAAITDAMKRVTQLLSQAISGDYSRSESLK